MSSSSSSRLSVHRHWKKSAPNSHTLGLIRQVRYEVEYDEDQNNGMLDVFEVNILKPKDDQRRHWRRFPASYLEFIKRFIYQSQLYIDSLDSFTTNVRKLPGATESMQKKTNHPKSIPKGEVIRMLKHYIHYMDNVIMQIWEDTRTAAVNDELGPDWRCSTLDEWLLVEYYVKRHNTADVEKHYAQTSTTDWMSSDPFELDWSEYEGSVPGWHHGGAHDYTIANMKQAEFSAASRGVLRWLENVPDESAPDESAPEDEGEEVGNRSGKEVKKEKEEEAKQKSKGKEAAPHTQTDTSNRKKASHKSGKDDDIVVETKEPSTSSKRRKKPSQKASGEDPLAPLTKGSKKASTSKKAEKKIEEDSESVGNTDKFVTTPADDKPKTKGSNKASRKATEGVKAKVESKAAGNAPASATETTGDKVRVKDKSSIVVKVKEESVVGKKRKSRGNLDIESKAPARRSLRNKPNQPEGSPSSSVVPLASIGSTPDPSLNDTPMEDWGTGVPSGAFFKSNPKSPMDKVDEGEDDVDTEDQEDDSYDGEGEDDEAGGTDNVGEDDEKEDEQEGTSDADSSDDSIV